MESGAVIKCNAGGGCTSMELCAGRGKCVYVSSARQMFEIAPLVIAPGEYTKEAMKDYVTEIIATSKVEDFSGKIDGAGVKGVMKEPKNPVELIPPQFLAGIADVLQFGAQKYAANNWMRGMSWTTVVGGILRHIFSFIIGDEIDKESGKPHLYHAACGLMFLCWYAYGPSAEEHRKFDDRVYK